VRPEKVENHENTNFQKASTTLDAGVVIYSKRVDSVHSETFKFLCGLSRTASPDDAEEGDDAEATGEEAEHDKHGEDTHAAAPKKGKKAREAAAAVTLEPNFCALNAKSLDAAFTVDPLFHKTSAMFDEGGAKGLLLNNLSVYRGCHVGFDSQLVPEQYLSVPVASTSPTLPPPAHCGFVHVYQPRC
jgi:condensin complex subunit 2